MIRSSRLLGTVFTEHWIAVANRIVRIHSRWWWWLTFAVNRARLLHHSHRPCLNVKIRVQWIIIRLAIQCFGHGRLTSTTALNAGSGLMRRRGCGRRSVLMVHARRSGGQGRRIVGIEGHVEWIHYRFGEIVQLLHVCGAERSGHGGCVLLNVGGTVN